MIDKQDAEELELYINNDDKLWSRRIPFFRNLATKKARGVYDGEKAVKLFLYFVEEAARRYAKEFSASEADWKIIFDKPTRVEVARNQVAIFEHDWKEGAFGHLLPKKYQNKPMGGKRRHGPKRARVRAGGFRVDSLTTPGIRKGKRHRKGRHAKRGKSLAARVRDLMALMR